MNAAVLIPAGEHHRGGRVGWLQSQCPVRPMPVVVVDVDPEYSFEMLAPDDQQPVEILGADGPDPALRVSVGVRCLDWRQHHIRALGAEDLVERSAELPVTVADEEAHPAPLLLHACKRLRACWVTQAASGLAVTPAKCTTLVSS